MTSAADVVHLGALASKDAELARLQAAQDVKDAELARLRDAALAAQDVRDVELAELRDVKDAEIARLQAALDVKSTELATEAARAAEVTAAAKLALADVGEKEEEIKRLTVAKEAEAAEAMQIMERLSTERNELKAELAAEVADRERVAPNGKRIKQGGGGSGRDLIRFPQ